MHDNKTMKPIDLRVTALAFARLAPLGLQKAPNSFTEMLYFDKKEN